MLAYLLLFYKVPGEQEGIRLHRARFDDRGKMPLLRVMQERSFPAITEQWIRIESSDRDNGI